jgi:MipA family protein
MYLPTLRPSALSTLTAWLLLALPLQPALGHGDDRRGADGGPMDGLQWGVGLGIKSERKPYTGMNFKSAVLPLLYLEHRYFRILGPEVDAKLPSLGPVSLRLSARYFEEGYKATDAPVLAGLDKRKSSFWMGGTATWHSDFADLSAQVLGDVASVSKGAQFKLGVANDFKLGSFEITPRVSLIWFDRKYVNYYFGVKSAEALPTRRRYEGGATVNTEVGFRVGHSPGLQQMLFLDLSATQLGNEIRDSPLVNRRTTPEAKLGYLYRF